MDMDFDGELAGGYSLNYPEIVKYGNIMALTKLLAHRMMENPYIVVGDFLKEMSDADLNALQDSIEEQNYEDVILISEMLATGEGCPSAKDMNEMQERANALSTFITITALGRKGLVKVHYDKLSFHEDSKKNIVVEKIDGLDYGALIDRFK